MDSLLQQGTDLCTVQPAWAYVRVFLWRKPCLREGQGVRREELVELVTPLLAEEGLELVACSVSRTAHAQVFRVSMDRDGGVSVEACERISRRLGDLLDANPILRGAYHMEVSSAGMNRPIWTLEHFRRFQGETAQVEVVGEGGKNRSIQGAIGPLDGDRLVLVLGGGREEVLSLGAVLRARLRIDPWKPRSRQPASGDPDGQESTERKDGNHGHG
jgi:ribosome maturation factor RimP